eukprot:CAMPEP_0197236904 /NCGR_PEP_ID=MMETSP1429-20130617/3886_1 /TAXON_ID=49237 /ORGANISM="Chaetoceros  sp., Strain UNC1202" /LENGTH=230 /DNA_ID=CAMNT_0042695797 /DNA_START=78 /DNA_END=770 /DNA_ORIENTATION=-
MNTLQNEATDLASKFHHENAWQTHIHPYDTENVVAMKAKHNIDPVHGSVYPKFTPICNKQSGDVVEYNYFVFPDYKAHMVLPSGSIVHRNFLCFVWHPVFEELRQFILDHPTHPDDMTMSTLVSHLSGKPLRTFPRNVQESEEKPAEDKVPRRKLLWQQKNWGNMREEAINSVLGYFGSVNPGSVGWCAGTDIEVSDKSKGNMRFKCKEYPTMDIIPWLQEGQHGYDECH